MQPADNFWYLVLISWGQRPVLAFLVRSYLAVLDALYDADIRFVLCRQEGAASFAAAAWGKLTGDRVSVL